MADTKVLTQDLESGVQSPGNSQYYGTDGAGNKGFHSLSGVGGGGEALFDNDTYLVGEDVTAGDSLFREDMVPFFDADQLQNVGDVAANTRVSCSVIGSGNSGDSINIALAKAGTPSVNLLVRIETDNAGQPSGTLVDANATGSISQAILSTSLDEITVTFTGLFSITKGDKAHVVISQVGDTVDASNYYIIGYDVKNTSTRGARLFDGVSYGAIDSDKFIYVGGNNILNPPVVDTGASVSTTIGGSTSFSRGYRFTADVDLVLTKVNKNNSSTATRARVKTTAGVTIATANFSGNVAQFYLEFNLGDGFRIELDDVGTTYTSTSNFVAPSYPYVGTNVTFVTGSQNGSDNAGAFNIDSIQTQEKTGSITDLVEESLLSLTDATYNYKYPIEFPRIATQNVNTGNECICIYKGLAEYFSGFSKGDIIYISDTPGAVSTTPGTNVCSIGTAFSDSILNVDSKGYKRESTITDFNIQRLNGDGDGTTTSSPYKSLNNYLVTFSMEAENNGGAVDNRAECLIQESDDGVGGWTTISHYEPLNADNRAITAVTVPFIKGKFYRSVVITDDGSDSGIVEGIITMQSIVSL